MPAKKYEFVPKKCAYCGKIMERKRFPKNNRLEDVAIYNKRKYCDRMCMRKAFLNIGENKGSGNWSSTHGTARGINNLILHKTECEICGKQGKLDVHHKDENSNNNDPDNLQVLCRSCHMKIHHPKPVCKVQGCENQVKGYGYCEKHYIRYKKYGNPLMVNNGNGKYEIIDTDNSKYQRNRHIIQITVDGEFVKEWKSARTIQNKTGYFESGINKCCNKKCRTYKGFIWRYADDMTDAERYEIIKPGE